MQYDTRDSMLFIIDYMVSQSEQSKFVVVLVVGVLVNLLTEGDYAKIC